MAVSLKAAAPEFEPRQSDSNSVYSFSSPAQWWMCSGKSSTSEVRKLEWVLSLPFISRPFKVGGGALSFPFCRMKNSLG